MQNTWRCEDAPCPWQCHKNGGVWSPRPTEGTDPHVASLLGMTRGVLFLPLRGRTAPVAIRNTSRTAPLVLPTAGHFLPTAAESTQRTPSKPMVLESFARLGCRLCGKSSATRTKRSGLTLCFRIVSALPSAGRSRGPALAWRDRDGFCVYRARCGERSERRPRRMKRGNRRSAASGGRSEVISRKCPDWRSRQWPGIGWHDGGPERVAAIKISSVRRKAAQKFWAPQQGHRALRNSIDKRCVGGGVPDAPLCMHFLPCTP